MDYEYVVNLQQSHTGIQLLRAKLFPLLSSFLWLSFIEKNQRVWRIDLLAESLDDYLHILRGRLGEDIFPRTGRDYLEDWSDKQSYLRKYYIEGDDTPRVELSAPIEKTLAWLDSLQNRSFVGTESRLETVFDLLRSLVRQSESDVDVRLSQLRQEKQLIERQIEQALAGDFPVLSETQVRERFSQLKDTAQALLRDFSEVEQNFRELDMLSRKRIAQQEGTRGEVLADIFDDADNIRDSDEGRSFTAFWEFLMSLSHQQEMDEMLEQVYRLVPLAEQREDRFLADLKLTLMEAADKVMITNRQLSEQLRRFLDDRARLDNRRISQLIQSARQQLILLKEADVAMPRGDWMRLTAIRANLNTPAPYLYRIPLAVSGQQNVEEADDSHASAETLFTQEYVDEALLMRQLRRCLEEHAVVSLPEVLAQFPPQQGLAELISYIKLASEDDMAMIDTEKEEELTIMVKGEAKKITVPHILYTR